MRLDTPAQSGVALQTMGTCELAQQAEFVNVANESDFVVFSAFGGKDPLIETHISLEFANLFRGNKHLVRISLGALPRNKWQGVTRPRSRVGGVFGLYRPIFRKSF